MSTVDEGTFNSLLDTNEHLVSLTRRLLEANRDLLDALSMMHRAFGNTLDAGADPANLGVARWMALRKAEGILERYKESQTCQP